MGRSGFSLHSTTMMANGVGDNGVLLHAGHRLFAVCLWYTGGANIKRAQLLSDPVWFWCGRGGRHQHSRQPLSDPEAESVGSTMKMSGLLVLTVLLFHT